MNYGNDRLNRIRKRFEETNLDGLIVTGPANRRYLSGFTGSNGALMIGADRAELMTDFRYKSQAGLEAPEFRLYLQKENLWKSVAESVQDFGWAKVGIESEHLTLADYEKLKIDAPVIEWIGVKSWIEQLRQIKDEREIEAIRQAVLLADQAWNEVWPTLHPGDVERDVALRLEVAMRQRGAEGTAFETIVASGPRGALPHGHAGDRRLAEGDLVVVDFGCILNGYHSDMTRTVAIGKTGAKHREVYELVLQAQQAAIDGLKPGMTGRDGDRIARGIIEEAGYGEFFGHGLGHSLGLEIHENPRLSPLDETVLEPGMLLTVEPGIYLPDWGGVRIEDVVVIAENGCEVLTTSHKEFTVVGE